MTTILKTDWCSRYQDAGCDQKIETLAILGHTHDIFLVQLNMLHSLPDMDWDMLQQYISSRRVAGALITVEVSSGLPAAVARPDAPTDLGQDGTSIWFTTPDTNLEEGQTMIYHYVNGMLTLSQYRDVTSSRSVQKSALGVDAGDVVQICAVDGNGVVGWWARIEVT